jgi:hypothetical protein
MTATVAEPHTRILWGWVNLEERKSVADSFFWTKSVTYLESSKQAFPMKSVRGSRAEGSWGLSR